MPLGCKVPGYDFPASGRGGRTVKLIVVRRPEHGPWAVHITSYDDDGDWLYPKSSTTPSAGGGWYHVVLTFDNGSTASLAARLMSIIISMNIK